MHVRKDDIVEVITGDDAGQYPSVSAVSRHIFHSNCQVFAPVNVECTINAPPMTKE